MDKKKSVSSGWTKPKLEGLRKLEDSVIMLAEVEMDNLKNKLERIKHVLETVKRHTER